MDIISYKQALANACCGRMLCPQLRFEFVAGTNKRIGTYKKKGNYFALVKELVDNSEEVYAEPVIEILLSAIGEILSAEDSGLLLEVKGEFPTLHEVIVCNDVSFEVVQKDKHRIAKIKAVLPLALVESVEEEEEE